LFASLEAHRNGDADAADLDGVMDNLALLTAANKEILFLKEELKGERALTDFYRQWIKDAGHPIPGSGTWLAPHEVAIPGRYWEYDPETDHMFLVIVSELAGRTLPPAMGVNGFGICALPLRRYHGPIVIPRPDPP
jgi:hypothetical protein